MQIALHLIENSCERCSGFPISIDFKGSECSHSCWTPMVRLFLGISSVCHLGNEENKDGENSISGDYQCSC